MLKLAVRRTFDSAHKLNDYEGKCANIHGHTWKVKFTFEVLGLQKNGISEDYGKVKSILDDILPDHQMLNDVYKEINPTAENLAKLLFLEMKTVNGRLENLKIQAVEIFETADNSAIYSE